MPSASELARQEAEIDAKTTAMDRAGELSLEEAGIRSRDQQTTMADAFEALQKRASDLGFTTISDALDYVADVKRGEL